MGNDRPALPMQRSGAGFYKRRKGREKVKTRYRTRAVIIAVIMAIFTLTGCREERQAVTVLYDTETLHIEQRGAETGIYDRINDTEYLFICRRVRVRPGQTDQIKEAKTAVNTSTLKVQTVYGILVITDKTAGKTVYIKRGE